MVTSPRRHWGNRSLVVLLGMFGACSRDGASVGTIEVGDLAVESALPSTDDVYLNDPVLIEFNHQLAVDSVSPTTVDIREVDAAGAPVGDAIAGTFELGNNGRLLLFRPLLPTDSEFSQGGLRPGRAYRVQLAQVPQFSRP